MLVAVSVGWVLLQTERVDGALHVKGSLGSTVSRLELVGDAL